MKAKKIYFHGEIKVGKTALIKRFSNKFFNEHYAPSILPQHHRQIINERNDILELVDMPGWLWANLTKKKIFSNYNDADVIVYCVDLTKAIDSSISKEIALIQEVKPFTPLILVGTKADINEAESAAKMEKIRALSTFGYAFITSAKTNEGVGDLLACLDRICTVNQPIWSNSKQKLLLQLSKLKKNKLNIVKNHLDELSKIIFSDASLETKGQAIDKFTINCNKILSMNWSKFILQFATVIAVTLIVAAIGFGIGFALGAWSGPGAFLSGFITSFGGIATMVATSAVCSAGVGLLYSKYRFLAPNKNNLDQFVKEINPTYETIPNYG